MTMGAAGLSRRRFVTAVGATVAAGPLTACARTPTVGFGEPIRIGYVSPRSGYQAHLTTSDAFALDQVRQAVREGLVVGNRRHRVEIQEADSTSEPGAAAEVAQRLVTEFGIQALVATTDAMTAIEVAEVAEDTGTPCLTSGPPWQAWMFGRGGDPDIGFIWSFHMSAGFEDLARVKSRVFGQVARGETAALLWPDDVEGTWARDEEVGLVNGLRSGGFGVLDTPTAPPRYPETFEREIEGFAQGGAGLVSGLVGPPDVLGFRGEADLLGYRPLAMTLASGGAAPSIIAALGPLGDGISCEVAWSPHHPFRSSLSDRTSAELGLGYAQVGGPPPALGVTHALFEVLLDAFVRSGDPSRKRRVVAALGETDLDTSVGPISFPASPIRNVAKIPVVAGQWVLDDAGEPVLELVEGNDLLGIRPTADVVAMAR